ncbi:MAG TPA: hypothetical protein VKH37_03095, partial [Ferruginibacter sp.]|nr:hypothetical protein [Ferruginibacter sp.]
LQPGSDHPIVKNMADVMSQFPNWVDTAVESEGIKRTVLLTSSTSAATESTPALIDINRVQQEESLNKLNKKNVPVAVLAEGKFRSQYALRTTQAQRDTMDAYNQTILSQCLYPSAVILASDADIVLNDYSEQIGPLPMGVNKYTKIQYANKDFFLNCLDYLGNKNSVLEARGKDYTLRILDPKLVATQKTTWQMINIAAPIALVCFFGFIYQLLRRRKYTRK